MSMTKVPQQIYSITRSYIMQYCLPYRTLFLQKLGYSDAVGLDDILCVYHTYIPQDCPRITRVSRDSWDTQTQWGWMILYSLYFMYIIPIYPRIVPGSPVYPGILGYSDAVGLDDILLLHAYIIPIYPRIVPGLPVYSGTPGTLRHSGVGR